MRIIGMQGIRVVRWEIGSGNEGNQGDTLRIGMKYMNKKCGEE